MFEKMRRAQWKQSVKPLYRYAVYGLAVASEQPFGSLEPAGGADTPTITICFVEPDHFRCALPVCPLKTEPGDSVAHVTLVDGSVYLKVDDIFEVVVSPDGCNVTCSTSATIDRRTFEANLMNFVLGTSLTLRGEEPLHSTVIDLDGRAIGLLGPSGAGKSTLAAFLIDRGADLVTDDMLRVEFSGGRLVAHQGPYRLKLLDESGRRFLPEALADGHFNSLSGKMMVRPRDVGRLRVGPVPLAGLYYIGELPGQPLPKSVSSVRLSGLELAKVILSSSMDDRYTAPDRLARQMAFAARLASILPIYALRYPRSFDVMDEVAAEIHRTIGS
jgi:hypothetical protein